MKKKWLIASGIIMLLVLASIGTIAYFTSSFESNNNTATAKTFNVEVVNTNGVVIGNDEFNLDDVLYPGMPTREAYEFTVNKNDTEVPVQYEIKITPDGELFPVDRDTPLVLTLQRYNEATSEWEDVNYSQPFNFVTDSDRYRILIDWPHTDNDIDFQSKTGKVHLQIIATQVDENTQPPAPTDPPDPDPTDPTDPNPTDPTDPPDPVEPDPPAQVPAEIQGTLVNTILGKAKFNGEPTVITYQFDEIYDLNYWYDDDKFKFYVNDGEGKSTTFNGDTHTGLWRKYSTQEVAYKVYSGIKDSSLKSSFTISQTESKIIFTSKQKKNYDKFEINVTSKDDVLKGTMTTEAGAAPENAVTEVNTLTVSGAVNDGGSINVNFNDGLQNVTKTISVTSTDTHTSIAAKIASEFNSLSEWNVTSNGANVVFTAKKAGPDKEVKIDITNK